MRTVFIIEWLFSENGRDVLRECRSILEELGLISWNSSTSSVYIHGLTLELVRKMLDENKMFLSRLFCLTALNIETVYVKLLADQIFSKLVFDTLLRANTLLRSSLDNYKLRFCKDDEVYRINDIVHLICQTSERHTIRRLENVLTKSKLLHLRRE